MIQEVVVWKAPLSSFFKLLLQRSGCGSFSSSSSSSSSLSGLQWKTQKVKTLDKWIKRLRGSNLLGTISGCVFSSICVSCADK